MYTIDTARRYPRDRALQRSLYGLQNRLDEDSEYIERSFSEELTHEVMGTLRIKCYVFKARTAERTARETLSTIRREFFKNDMCVLFSMNGQVHGSYTSEFVTRALKFHLLKNHLLIHVDCTSAQQEFRNELFMASRDRLKKGTESSRLRQELSTLLSTGRLKDLHSARKASIAVDDEDAEELIRKVARDLPIGGELAKLLGQTFDLKDRRRGGKEHRKRRNVDNKQANGPAFSGRRFPSFFRIKKPSQSDEGIPITGVPLGGAKTIQFGTDVEDQYFDRADEPGELRIAVLSPLDHGGSGPRPVQPHYRVMNVVKSSPESGTIRLRISPTREARVGDTVRIRASLSSPGEELREVFEVKVADRKNAPSKPKRDEARDLRLALPKLVRTYRQTDQSTQSHTQSWDQVEGSGVGSMDHDVVVLLLEDGDKLDTVFVNMDSRTLLAERGRAATTEARQIVEKRYISAVYFHALFLYAITKSRRYELTQKSSDEEPGQRDIAEYIADLFSHYYAQFLLSLRQRNSSLLWTPSAEQTAPLGHRLQATRQRVAPLKTCGDSRIWLPDAQEPIMLGSQEVPLLSGYFDPRSELFQRAFGEALPYREYLATGNRRPGRGPTRRSRATRIPAPIPRRPHRERALPQRDLVRGLRSVGSDRGPARRGGRTAR